MCLRLKNTHVLFVLATEIEWANDTFTSSICFIIVVLEGIDVAVRWHLWTHVSTR